MNPLDIKIENIKHLMSTRLLNGLRSGGAETLADVVARKDYEWLRESNFGNRTLRELNDFLSRYELKIEGRVYKNRLPKPKSKMDILCDKVFELQVALMAVSRANKLSDTPNKEIDDIITRLMGE